MGLDSDWGHYLIRHKFRFTNYWDNECYKQIMNGITIKGRISRLSGQEKLVHQLLNVVPLVIDNIYSIS